MSDDVSFLNRWSRLKRRVSLERDSPKTTDPAAPPLAATAEPAPAMDAQPPSEGAAPTAPVRERSDEEPVDLAKLPPIESLGPNSDYSMFMRKGVPEDVRMKALRRMWLTDPVLAGPELLDMYAFDYTGVDGHKPLVRPVVEAVAAAAKAAKEALSDGKAVPPSPAKEPQAAIAARPPEPAADGAENAPEDPAATKSG